MRVGADTHRGRIRRTNEDAYHAGSSVVAVADGMGGHALGEVASRLAVTALAEWANWEDPKRALHDSLLMANEQILQRAQVDPMFLGMGTTITACYLYRMRMYYVHVGDSRLYLYREGRLQQLTRDHSVVGELQRSGELTEAEARRHPQRNVLTRALGVDRVVEPDSGAIEARVGDRYLLSTDGLHGVLSSDHLTSVMAAESDPAKLASRLIRLAKDLGSSDDMTAVVAEVTEDDRT